MIHRRHLGKKMKDKVLSQGKGPVAEGDMAGPRGGKRDIVSEAQTGERRWCWRGRWGPEISGL